MPRCCDAGYKSGYKSARAAQTSYARGRDNQGLMRPMWPPWRCAQSWAGSASFPVSRPPRAEVCFERMWFRLRTWGARSRFDGVRACGLKRGAPQASNRPVWRIAAGFRALTTVHQVSIHLSHNRPSRLLLRRQVPRESVEETRKLVSSLSLGFWAYPTRNDLEQQEHPCQAVLG